MVKHEIWAFNIFYCVVISLPTSKSSAGNMPLAKRNLMVYLACVCYLLDLFSITEDDTNPKSAEIPITGPTAISISKVIILAKGLRTGSKNCS